MLDFIFTECKSVYTKATARGQVTLQGYQVVTSVCWDYRHCTLLIYGVYVFCNEYMLLFHVLHFFCNNKNNIPSYFFKLLFL